MPITLPVNRNQSDIISLSAKLLFFIAKRPFPEITNDIVEGIFRKPTTWPAAAPGLSSRSKASCPPSENQLDVVAFKFLSVMLSDSSGCMGYLAIIIVIHSKVFLKIKPYRPAGKIQLPAVFNCNTIMDTTTIKPPMICKVAITSPKKTAAITPADIGSIVAVMLA